MGMEPSAHLIVQLHLCHDTLKLGLVFKRVLIHLYVKIQISVPHTMVFTSKV